MRPRAKARPSQPAQTTKDRSAPGASGPSAVSKPATPKSSAASGSASTAKPAPSLKFEPPADWDAFFKGIPDVSEAQILLDVDALHDRNDLVGIEKALKAYLKYHGKHAAPWMYQQLATVMEMNKRDPKEIKIAYGWGAMLAQKSKDWVALIAAADQFLLHKYDEVELPAKRGETIRLRLSDLLDQAMAAAPHRAEPVLMGLVHAENLSDPQRMGDAADRMLSLGWPGKDAVWRTEIPKRVRNLAKKLKENGRGSEALTLLNRLPEIESRDLIVRLTWTGDAALELSVEESLGATCDHFTPRTVFGGSLIKEGRGRDKEAVYVCPRAFDGDYVIRVKVLYNDEKKPAQTAKLEIITHEGGDDEKILDRTVSLTRPQPVTVNLQGGRRKEVLPYRAQDGIQAPKATEAKAAEQDKASNPQPIR